MTRLRVNGREMEFEEALTLEELLERLNIPKEFIAVERNGELVEDLVCLLDDGDRLEIARFVGGG